MLKLKLQYFGHLTQRANSLVKTLMLGKIENRKRRGQQKMRWLCGIRSLGVMMSNRLGSPKKSPSTSCLHLVHLDPWDSLPHRRTNDAHSVAE